MSFNIGDKVRFKDAVRSGVPQFSGQVGVVSRGYGDGVHVQFVGEEEVWTCLEDELDLVVVNRPLAKAMAALKELDDHVDSTGIRAVFPDFDVNFDGLKQTVWLPSDAFNLPEYADDIPKLLTALRAVIDLLETREVKT